MFTKVRSTRNKDDQATTQHSLAVAIATATATATASSRVLVAKKGGGGRPCLDSKLVQHPLKHTTFTAFITSTTTAAVAITTVAAAATATPVAVATPTPTKNPPPTAESELTSTKTTAVATLTIDSNEKVAEENQLENKTPENAPAPVEEGRGQRPYYDSALIHHPLSQPIFDAAPTIFVTVAASTTPNDTEITSKSTETEGNIVEPGKNQLEIIPLDLLLNIAVLLPSSRDFANLSQTCQYIHRSLDERWVWHQRFLLRIGKALLISLLNPRNSETDELLAGKTMPIEDTTVVSKEMLKDWYRTYTRTAVPPKEMGISHIKDHRYWEYVDDPRCPYGQAAKLMSGLWWLDIRGILFGVLPGRYWVQWGLGLRNASSIVGTQFRVAPFSNDEVPEPGNDAENSIDYTPQTFRDFLHHTNVTNKDIASPTETIIFQLPQVLVVEEDKPTLFVHMREHNREKNGLTVLFVRIIPASDDGEDVKAEREEVEGERDATVAGEVESPWMDRRGGYFEWDELDDDGEEEYDDDDDEEDDEDEDGGEDILTEDSVEGEDNGDEIEGAILNFLNFTNGGFGSLNGGAHAGGGGPSSFSHHYNNTLEDDGNARPYSFR